MSSHWRFLLFGGLRPDAERVEARHLALARFDSRKSAALLSLLLLAPDHPHSREELTEALWPESDLEAGRNRFKQALALLRKQLEPEGDLPANSVLLADRTEVRLMPGTVETDLADFKALLRRATAAEAPEKAGLLARAVDLYQGELLPGFYEDAVLAERNRIAERFRTALLQLATVRAEAGDMDGAIEAAGRVITADPVTEEGHLLLLRLYVQAGRPGEVARAYRHMEQVYAQELGTTPPAAARRFLDLAPVIIPTPPVVAPPAVMAPKTVAPLPPTLTRFYGREREISHLVELLSRHSDPERRERLVTLTGSGGSGKTRLAREVYTRLTEAEGFAAAWFVVLTDTTTDDAPRRIAEVLHGGSLPAQMEPGDAVRTALERRPTLLVLDNLEQLLLSGSDDTFPIAGFAGFVSELLHEHSDLVLLTTSRVHLGIDGEREYPVPPLPTPAAPSTPERLSEFASIRLFVDRARAANPRFTLTESNAADVAALCRRLEGIPLSLELAAAWSSALAPGQMLERVARRFDLLVSRSQRHEPRHRSLRALLEWSFRLLSAEEQRFLAYLSVFRDGWNLEAAEAICAEDGSDRNPFAHEVLAGLRGASFVVEGGEGFPGDPEDQERDKGFGLRLRLLETVREFAEEKLAPDECEAVRRRHAAFFATFVEQNSLRLRGAQQAETLHLLDSETENLRAALAWALDTDLTLCLRIGRSMWHYWEIRGRHEEGRKWIRTALDRDTELGGVITRRLRVQATLNYANLVFDAAESQRLYQEVIPLAEQEGMRREVAAVHNNLGILAGEVGDYTAARDHYLACYAILETEGAPDRTSACLNNLGIIHAHLHEFEAARSCYERSLVIKRAIGNRLSIAGTLNNLGHLSRMEGDLAAAQAYCEQAIAILREHGDLQKLPPSLENYARILHRRGSIVAATDACRESLRIRTEMGDQVGALNAIEILAAIARTQGEYPRAVTFWAIADTLRRDLGAVSGLDPTTPEEAAEERAALRTILSPDDHARAHARGEALTWEQVLKELVA